MLDNKAPSSPTPLPSPVTSRRPSCRAPLTYISLRLLALLGLLLVVERLILPSRPWPAGYYRGGPDASQHTYIQTLYKNNRPVSNPFAPVVHAPLRSKALIASAIKEDNTTWITNSLSDWEANVYIMDDADANVTVAKQKGREAAAYLTYIITHYHNLPEYMVFIHAQQYQWHNDDMMFDHLPNLQNLHLSAVSKLGYTSLRCAWDPGCPIGVEPDPEHEDGFWDWQGEFARAWADFFPQEEVPRQIGTPCCAQFAVTRDRVRLRPVHFYERIRQWLWDSDTDAQKTGRILEYTWHKIFGENATSCPDTQTCYCRLYGYCDLDCPRPGMCENRLWKLRLDQGLPKEWPDEGQGVDGLPRHGWWLSDEHTRSKFETTDKTTLESPTATQASVKMVS